MPIILPDLTGQRCGRLIIVKCAGSNAKKYKLYECLCDCGKTKLITASLLYRKDIQSCGCMLREARNRNLVKAQKSQVKHGLAGTLIHQTWASMMARCYNHRHDRFPQYGGAGIGLCDFLRASPQNLLSIVGQRPERRYSIDRIDGKLGYHCGQCEQCLKMGWVLNIKWSTPKEQAMNRQNNIWITIGGVTKTCADWARQLNKSFNWVRRHHS